MLGGDGTDGACITRGELPFARTYGGGRLYGRMVIRPWCRNRWTVGNAGGGWQGWCVHHQGRIAIRPYGSAAYGGGRWMGGGLQFARTFPYVLNFPYLCKRYAN